MAIGIPNPYTPMPQQTSPTPSGSVMDQAANMSPTFINPSYATPQQMEQLRFYANSLMQHANTMPVKSGWQGLAQMANSLVGGLSQGQYNREQQQYLQGQREDLSNAAKTLLGQNSQDQPSVAPSANSTSSALSYAPTADSGTTPSSSSDLPSMVNTAFSSRGIDPSLAMRVISGEGGFDPSKMASGDDGSSFGPMQFHYGGISKKYPNPGLGDAFTRDTGLDARDPSTVQQQLEYAANRVATNGWGDWKGSSSHSDITGNMGVGPNAHPMPLTPYGQPQSTPQPTPPPQNQVADSSGTVTPSPSTSSFSGGPSSNAAPAVQAIQQGAIGGGPLNAIISALRGNSPTPTGPMASPRPMAAPTQGGMPNPAMIGSILANPGISDDVKTAIRQYISPTMVPGPLGQQIQTSPAAIAAGRPGAVAANPGQVISTDVNGVKVPVYQAPGSNGQAPPSGTILGPGDTGVPNGTTPPGTPFNAPGTPIGKIIGAQQDQAVLAEKKTQNFAEYQQARKDQLDLNNAQIPLNSLQAIIQRNGGTLPTGPGSDSLATIASTANLVGTLLGHPLTSDDSTLTGYQVFSKYAGTLAQEQAKRLNVRPSNLDLYSSQSINPNTDISGPANVHLIDYLTQMNKLSQEQSKFKQQYYKQNGNFDDFNDAWLHHIGRDEPNSDRAFVTSKMPVKSVPGSQLGRNDGSTWDQVESTDPSGYSWKQHGTY